MSRGISLDVDLANQIGINAAIVYNELTFWNIRGKREDGWIYKTFEEMMERLPLSRMTIRRSYDKLRKVGLIETKVMKVGNTPILHYKLNKSESTNLVLSIDSPNLVLSSINTKKVTKKVVAEATQLLKKVIEIVNPREKVTDSRIRELTGRLKDYSSDEIVAAAKSFAKSEWHKENGQMSVDNLIRASKFGRWYNAESRPKSRIEALLEEEQNGAPTK